MQHHIKLGYGYIGGVCEGLGNYTPIPAILWRIAFLLVPNAILLYLLLWAVLEKEE